MLPAMAAKPSIAIIGPGRLGTGLALALSRAGYSVKEIVSHAGAGSKRKAARLAREVGARTAVFPKDRLKSDVVWLCIPDREISKVATELAAKRLWKGDFAFHSSGALASDELQALRRQGVPVAAVHSLMTFVAGSNPELEGVPFGLEGDSEALKAARTIVRNLGGNSFVLAKESKAAYHAWGAFLSPLLVALLVASEQVAGLASISQGDARKRMIPILKQTLQNYAALGPAGAFSGPLVRGDEQVVRRHLKVLKKVPEAREAYVALARLALKRLPVQRRRRLEEVLGA